MVPTILYNYDQRIHLEELLTFSMALLLNILIIIFSHFTLAPVTFTINIAIMLLIIATVFAQRFATSKLFSVYRDWYVLPLLVAIFMEHNMLVPLINPNDIDSYLIKIDYSLFFGNHPTLLLERIMHPFITELLQIVYASFYFLPFTLCLLLYLKERKVEFHVVASSIMFGFYLSYIGYYIFPAIGPRFTLAQLQTKPLEGLLLFNFVHHGLAYLEGVTRDCFPSGHTLVSILTVLLAMKYHKRFSIIATVWAVLLIISTVYLRYHYVIDVIAGFCVGLIAFRYGPMLARLYIFGNTETKTPLLDSIRNLWYWLLDIRRR